MDPFGDRGTAAGRALSSARCRSVTCSSQCTRQSQLHQNDGAQVMHGFPMCHKIALFSPWLEPAALFLARLVWKKGFGTGNIESYSAVVLDSRVSPPIKHRSFPLFLFFSLSFFFSLFSVGNSSFASSVPARARSDAAFHATYQRGDFSVLSAGIRTAPTFNLLGVLLSRERCESKSMEDEFENTLFNTFCTGIGSRKQMISGGNSLPSVKKRI